MLEPPAFAAAVADARRLALPYTGLAYRAIHLRHFANFPEARPLFCPGGGAGSRYVAPGGPAALYSALDAGTAYREVNQDFLRIARTPAGRRLLRTGGLRPDPLVTIGS